jgi:hypothetical protein
MATMSDLYVKPFGFGCKESAKNLEICQPIGDTIWVSTTDRTIFVLYS